MEWQPIATAPKDGTFFLGYWPEKRRLEACILPTYWDEHTSDGPRFVDVDDNCFENPTHWMPLPAKPEAA